MCVIGSDVESAIINCLYYHEKNEKFALFDYQTEMRSLFEGKNEYDANVRMSAGKLKKCVEQRLGHGISPDTFYNSRLKDMTEDIKHENLSKYTVSPILGREFDARGKKYFIF
ncbi:MAG: hypothetical protein WA631_02925 [Nitrososphaeraceae archaeon]